MAAKGKKGHRRIFLTFRLDRAARVVFDVKELFPVCRFAGRFAVAAHAGLNRVPFSAKLHGRPLPPGSYSVTARPRGGAQVLAVKILVVASGVPSPAALRSAQTRDACAAVQALAANELEAEAFAGSGQTAAASTEVVRNAGTAASSSARPREHVAALSATHLAKQVTNPLVVAALAAAVFLLGVSALPQRAVADARLSDLFVRHRLEVALAGVGALAAALVALIYA